MTGGRFAAGGCGVLGSVTGACGRRRALPGARLTGRLLEVQLVRALGLAALVAGTAAALQALL